MRRPNWEKFKSIRHERQQPNMGPLLTLIAYLSAFMVGAAWALLLLLWVLGEVPATGFMFPGRFLHLSGPGFLGAVAGAGGITGVVVLWKWLREEASGRPPKF